MAVPCAAMDVRFTMRPKRRCFMPCVTAREAPVTSAVFPSRNICATMTRTPRLVNYPPGPTRPRFGHRATETRRSLRVSVAEDLTVKNHKVLLTNAVYPWLFEREVRNAPKGAACGILALIRKDPSAGCARGRGADEEGLDSVHG